MQQVKSNNKPKPEKDTEDIAEKDAEQKKGSEAGKRRSSKGS